MSLIQVWIQVVSGMFIAYQPALNSTPTYIQITMCVHNVFLR